MEQCKLEKEKNGTGAVPLSRKSVYLKKVTLWSWRKLGQT